LRWLLVLLAALTVGCQRGCSLNGAAKACQAASDCDPGIECYKGYCSDPAYVAADRACRDGDACRERGACGATAVESFLGLDGRLECAAVAGEDCQASTGCTDAGRCALSNTDCVAASDEGCRSSVRCTTHEECSLGTRECVRRWPSCPPLTPVPGAPPWAIAGPFALDDAKLPDAWKPGAVGSAVLVCRANAAHRWPGRVRLGERCAPLPPLDDQGAVTFVKGGIPLEKGTTITVAFQKRDDVGSPSTDSFVKAAYDGASPFSAGAEPDTLECHVLAPELLAKLALAELARADKKILEASRSAPDRGAPQPLAPGLEVAEEATSHAAELVGWEDKGVKARVARVDAAAQAWGRALGLLHLQLAPVAAPLDRPTLLDGVVTVQPRAFVCGEALRARHGERAKDRTLASSDCALELLLENKSDTEMTVAAGGGNFARIEGMRFLRPSAGGAEAIEAVVIDVRAAAEGSPFVATLTLAPGAKAIALLAGKTRELALGRGSPDERALLVGHVKLPFALRTDLVK
jgi:hypothetical protein